MDLATNVPAGLIGIGGSPGESVFVKAGASTVEPTAEEGDNRHLRTNIDKGNQAQGGESMVVLGNVAHPDVLGKEYRIKTLDNKDLPLMVDTDSEGRVWLIVGTDSGFEGLSALYYSRISYTLSTVEPPSTGGYKPPVWAVALVAGIRRSLGGWRAGPNGPQATSQPTGNGLSLLKLTCRSRSSCVRGLQRPEPHLEDHSIYHPLWPTNVYGRQNRLRTLARRPLIS